MSSPTLPGPWARQMIHATSSESINAMQRTRLVLPSHSHTADGPLALPAAPKCLWFTANTYHGRTRTTSVYGRSLDDKVPALVVDVNRLLSVDDPTRAWDLFKVKSEHSRRHHLKYAIAAVDYPEWLWLSKHCQCVAPDGDENIRLMRVSTSTNAWMLYAKDATSNVDIECAPLFVCVRACVCRLL